MWQIFKVGFLGLFGLIVCSVILVIVDVVDDKKETTSTEPKQGALTTEPVTNEEPKKEEAPKNKTGISKAEFNQIRNGMNYEEVKNIIGSDGEIVSESGQVGDQFHTIMYSWKCEKGLGTNARFMFQEGKLQNKSQFGLK